MRARCSARNGCHAANVDTAKDEAGALTAMLDEKGVAYDKTKTLASASLPLLPRSGDSGRVKREDPHFTRIFSVPLASGT
jgi:hypothetical protein